MAIDPGRDATLHVVPGERLFEASTTRIAIRRGNYPRGHAKLDEAAGEAAIKEAEIRAASGAGPR